VVLAHPGRYKEVRAESADCKGPESLKVKQVEHNGHRYIVCRNPRQARKEARDREVILAALKEQIKKGAKSLVGNKALELTLGTPDFRHFVYSLER
jgi:DNA repair exonuclease SbcCD ATPase subunit